MAYSFLKCSRLSFWYGNRDSENRSGNKCKDQSDKPNENIRIEAAFNNLEATYSPEQLWEIALEPHDFVGNFDLIWFANCKTIKINLYSAVIFP